MKNLLFADSSAWSFNYFASITLTAVIFFSFSINAQSQDEVIFFDSDTNNISEKGVDILRETAESLEDTSEYTITLEGYSDITGKANYNLELSAKRAQLVKDFLVELGLNASNIKVIGKGGTEKYGVGETNEALQANRRVNLTLDIPYVPAIEIVEEPKEDQQTEQKQPEEEIEITDELETDNTNEVSLDEVMEEEIPVKPVIKYDIKKIEREVRQNASEGIVFITPREMDIGESYTVEADISMSFLDRLSSALPDLNLQDNMGLILAGNNFDIENDSDSGENFKLITESGPTTWKWDVTPTVAGYGSLTLLIEVVPDGSDSALNSGFATFERVVDVKPSFIYSITSSYWIMGVLTVLLIALVAWVLLKRIGTS